MFAGKTVVVTGSSSGIGAQAAVEFAKQGANIILHGRNRETLAQVEKACLSTGAVKNDQIASVIGDICDDHVQKELIDSAIRKFGKINVLVSAE
uniref:Uncharacterized protein n=1 Tax=Romanomermis culicivorax TaxID=13658 RepID=A0A915L1F7_ROMCU